MGEYADRDIFELAHYGKHVHAMTKEKLHAKSDIAAELAFRDGEIDRLEAENQSLREQVEWQPIDPNDGTYIKAPFVVYEPKRKSVLLFRTRAANKVLEILGYTHYHTFTPPETEQHENNSPTDQSESV